MAAPRSTLWPLDPHTAAKHAILRRYLDAWLPILSHGGFPDLFYIDAFAGPGRYEGGEDGSPIIALKALLNHQSKIRARCHFYFVEAKTDRAEALEDNIARLLTELGCPSNVTTKVYSTQFEDAYPAIKEEIGARRGPMFAFIDPFGWTGMPFSIVRELMQRPSCETLINFMYEEINRFLGHPDQVKNFDSLFGTDLWRTIVDMQGTERARALHDLYAFQLRGVGGVKYVRSFEMRNFRDVTDYFLFFASNSLLGLKKMKAAMWGVDELGGGSFSDATNRNQIVLFDEPDYSLLRRAILERFHGKAVAVETVEEFVVAETAFRETHYKRILKQIEREDPHRPLVPNAKQGRRQGTFPPGTVICFP